MTDLHRHHPQEGCGGHRLGPATMTRELLQQAVDALNADHHFGDYEELVAAIRAELNRPEPEWVGEVIISTDILGKGGVQVVKWVENAPATKVGLKLYTAPPTPAGYKLVPIEPTPAMIRAIDGCLWHGGKRLYEVMLAAAPETTPHD